MKYLIALIGLLLVTVATPVFADEKNECCVDAEKDACEAKAAKLGPGEHKAFMKSCLEKAAKQSKTMTQKNKEEQCEQNVKNMNLEGEKKKEYLEHCYRENDFDRDAPPHPKM